MIKKLILLIIFFITCTNLVKANNDFDVYKLKSYERLQRQVISLETKVSQYEMLYENSLLNKRQTLIKIKKLKNEQKNFIKNLIKNHQVTTNKVFKIINQEHKLLKRNYSDRILYSLDLLKKINNEIESIVANAKSKVYGSSNGSGVFGQVTKVTGNCMPKVGELNYECNNSYLETSIIIHKPIKASELNDHHYYENESAPIAMTVSDDFGMYILDLDPGVYSIFFLDEDHREYCNHFDGNGIACPITVKEGYKTEVDLILDWAVY